MPNKRTAPEKAAGKLISAIQKEWGKESGESTSNISEDVMDRGHELLQATKNNSIMEVLGNLSISEYLGELWVRRHPSVLEYIRKLEKEIK
jgi:hypothetical protein